LNQIGIFQLLLLLVFTAVSGASIVQAAVPVDQRVAIPLVFSVEGDLLRTTACIPLIQKTFGEMPWQVFRKTAKRMPEVTLLRTIEAIKGKNKTRFIEMSHPVLGRDPEQLAFQMNAFMQQLNVVDMVSVDAYIKFDDFLLYMVTMRYQGKDMRIDFLFALDEQGTYRFLPYRTRDLAYEAVLNWAVSDWGIGGSDPAYCSDENLAVANHQIPFDEADKYNKLAASLLVKARKLKKDPGKQPLLKAVDKMKRLLRAGKYDGFLQELTPKGTQIIGSWFDSVSKEEKAAYAERFFGREPFYVLDAEPFYVVYANDKNYGIQVMYFVKDGSGSYRWANANYGTSLDRIFNQEMVLRSIAQPEPLQEWKHNDG